MIEYSIHDCSTCDIYTDVYYTPIVVWSSMKEYTDIHRAAVQFTNTAYFRKPLDFRSIE